MCDDLKCDFSLKKTTASLIAVVIKLHPTFTAFDLLHSKYVMVIRVDIAIKC